MQTSCRSQTLNSFTHVLTDLVWGKALSFFMFVLTIPPLLKSSVLEDYNQHQDISAQEDLMLLCHSGRYCFSKKGFSSHFIETDSAIHHSQVYANALFKQCQCIIAQGLKEWALHTSQNYYISSCPFSSHSFSSKMKLSRLCFCLHRLLLCSRTWMKLNKTWLTSCHLREDGLRMGKGNRKFHLCLFVSMDVKGRKIYIHAQRGSLNLYFRLYQCLMWNDFKLQ